VSQKQNFSGQLENIFYMHDTLFIAQAALKPTTTTTTVSQPFVRDYPGEPVPEETFMIHPPTILIIIQSLSASSIYHDP